MSDIVTWEDLIKAVGDLTTITDEIDAKLLTHNQDPSSHGQAGEVVNVHRAETEIDHPDGSISLKKMVKDKIIKMTDWTSLDGFTVSGLNTIASFMGAYFQAAGGGNRAVVYEEGPSPGSYVDFLKNPFFQTTVEYGGNTDQTAYLLMGARAVAGAGDSFGFKIVNANLYACWAKAGTEYTQLISGVDILELTVYRAYYDSTVDKVYFYVNGVLEYTATTNTPVSVNSFVIYFDIYTDGASNRAFRIFDLLWMRDR